MSAHSFSYTGNIPFRDHSMNDGDTSFLDVHTSALLRITSAIETATTLDELLMLSLHEITRFIGVPRSGIVLLREDEESVQLVSAVPLRVTMPPPVALSSVPRLQQIINHRQSQQIERFPQEVANSESRFFLENEQEKLCSALLVPLVAQDRSIGAVALATLDAPRHFTDVEISLVRVLTGPLAAAIAAFQTTEAARRRSAELATINEIASAVTSSLNKSEIYKLVVRQLNEYFHVDAGSLLLRDEDTGELVFVMTLEGGAERLVGTRVPRGRGVVGHVAETGRYAIVYDAQNDPRFYSKISEDTGYVTESILCVPMLFKGQTIGVIELLNKQEGLFTENDARRLMRMASTIGIALENARLFQQVKTNRDLFKAILNSTNDGIVMVDMHSTILLANPPAADLFQLSRQDIVGKNMNDLLEGLYERATSVGTPPWLSEDDDEHGMSRVVELELPGTHTRHIRYFSLPVQDDKQAVIGQLMLLQDVSKERELSRLRDDFTGMLVHDLRAPLTSIMNGVTMIRRGLGGPVSEQQTNLLDIAYKSSQTMLEMINTLLDISKMEEGRMPLNYEPISPYALVDDPVARLYGLAQEHQVQVVQNLPMGLPLVEADREKLVRVLQNLLDNAIKFSPAGKDVTLGVAYVVLGPHGVQQYVHSESDSLPVTLPPLAQNEWMVFWVRDQGEGISPQHHKRIFEKFGQVRGRKMRGTGLGLTFCKLAVESHRGHIWLESDVGKGSTFALALPIMRTSE
jgi:PAS domain S-box-containing protein